MECKTGTYLAWNCNPALNKQRQCLPCKLCMDGEYISTPCKQDVEGADSICSRCTMNRGQCLSGTKPEIDCTGSGYVDNTRCVDCTETYDDDYWQVFFLFCFCVFYLILFGPNLKKAGRPLRQDNVFTCFLFDPNLKRAGRPPRQDKVFTCFLFDPNLKRAGRPLRQDKVPVHARRLDVLQVRRAVRPALCWFADAGHVRLHQLQVPPRAGEKLSCGAVHCSSLQEQRAGVDGRVPLRPLQIHNLSSQQEARRHMHGQHNHRRLRVRQLLYEG